VKINAVFVCFVSHLHSWAKNSHNVHAEKATINFLHFILTLTHPIIFHQLYHFTARESAVWLIWLVDHVTTWPVSLPFREKVWRAVLHVKFLRISGKFSQIFLQIKSMKRNVKIRSNCKRFLFLTSMTSFHETTKNE